MENLGTGDPRQVGRYTLVGRLGAGGMGAVYLGRSGGRTVAVKVAHAEPARDPGFRERFAREVRAARKVSGAFTAAVVDADPAAEVPWMATAFVVGVPLHQAVATHGPLPEATLWTLTAGLAEALTSIHDVGLIHRDFKPSNVMLALNGPHVIDFGISRAVGGTPLTRTGAAVGSVPYMSPEQTLGLSLTAASDIFSLGSTVAYAALGSHLFGDGPAATVGYRIVHTEPDLGAVPAGLRPLVQACLAREPAARPTPQQVIEYIGRDNPQRGEGGWLPQAVVADIVGVRNLLTDLTGRPFAGRRKLLLGAGGAVVSVAGAATGLWLAGGDEEAAKNTDATGTGGASSRPRPVRRPSGDVPEGRVAWKVNHSVPSPQVLPADGVVACVSGEAVRGVDDKGDTRWTVNGRTGGHGLAFAANTTTPKTVAAVDNGRLYVAGAWGTERGVAAIDMAAGEVVSTTALGGRQAAVLGFWGIREGLAYLLSSGGADDPEGRYVRALDLAARTVVWSHRAPGLPVSPALPLTGGHIVFTTEHQRVRALDDRGGTAWERRLTAVLAATRSHVIVLGESGTLYALDPKTGDRAWSADGAAEASSHGDSIATGDDGRLLYGLWQDEDGGHSLRCLDSTSGAVRWQAPVPAGPKDAQGSGVRLLCADGNLYWMASDAVVWAADPENGRVRWKFSGLRGARTAFLAWAAGDGRLCLSDPGAHTVAALHANGA